MLSYRHILLLIVVTMMLVACGGDDTPAATPLPSNTPLPPMTPTPRSTPLPPVPSPVPVGVEDRPLHLAFVAQTSAANNRVANAIEEALITEMRNFDFGMYEGLQIEVQLLGSRAEAVNLLCNGGTTAVFVDIFTYAAAAERCDVVPVLRVQKGTGRTRTTGTNFEFVVNTDRINSLGRMLSSTERINESFCTMSLDSESFVHPALALRAMAANEEARQALRLNATLIDLLNPESIEVVLPGENTYETDVEMVQKLQGGPNVRLCESLALPAGRFAEIVDELADEDIELQSVGVFEMFGEPANEALMWPEIPYEVLVFPPETLFPAVLREEVLRAITTLEEDDAAFKRSLNTLVEHTALLEVPENGYADFLAWLELAGWDMAEPIR